MVVLHGALALWVSLFGRGNAVGLPATHAAAAPRHRVVATVSDSGSIPPDLAELDRGAPAMADGPRRAVPVTESRGFPTAAPWAGSYGSAQQIGDLAKAARTYRILNIDADPGVANFTRAQIARLKHNGANKVISYLDLGSMEHWRDYWTRVPAGFVSGKANLAAQLGPYGGYPDETWMDLGNADYQNLIINYVAPRLVAQGVDGFFFDNMELVEHSATSANGPCSPSTRQGGLDLVYKLRQKYPNLLFVMQNATGDITRLGITNGVAFPTLLDGVSHEEVYEPTYDSTAETELLKWRRMGLMPGGHPFWIATEDYEGRPGNLAAARQAYDLSRANGFSPYVTDASGGQQSIWYWPF